ncbi:MAG: hypothetical protein NVS3B18_16350 [Candidatus Dormibacteria bacterium]
MLCLLGFPTVADGAIREPLRLRPKAMALLARVALAEDPVPRAVLARALFDEADEPRARLRWYLSHLRAALPEALRDLVVLSGDTVGFNGVTDVGAFRTQVQAFAPAEALDSDALDMLAGVLDLYRGDLCDGLVVTASVAFDTWMFVEQEQLRRVFRRAVLAFARSALRLNRAEMALGPLTRLVAVDPYCEDAHLLLIGASEHARSAAAARSAYEQYQRVMRTELHSEPRASVAARYEAVAVTAPGLPVEDLIPLRTITQHIVEWSGTGPTVLGIHGSAQSAYSLTALGERLAGKLRFIGVDLRGHGYSDKPPIGYEVADHVEDLRELIRALRLHRPLVLGHSLGGAVAAFLAATEDLSGLILLDGVVGDQAFVANAAAQVVGPFGAELEQRFGGFEEYLQHWHRTSSSRYGDLEERWITRCARYTLAPLPDGSLRMRALRRALEDEWASVGRCDALAALRRVRCPVLIVHAALPWLDGRPYLSDDAIAAQLAAARTSQLHIAYDCDHETVLRAPDPPLIDAITAFACG